MSKPPPGKPIVILGGGGHARVVIDALRCAGYVIAGVIDPKADVAATLPEGITWLGKDLSSTRPDEVQVAIGVGSIDVGARNPRPMVFAEAKAGGFQILSFRHPSAIVAGDVALGEGSQIMAGAILQTGAGHEKELWGGEPSTTNNRMELMAAIAALEALKRPCRVDLHTDSKYVMQGITEWIRGWKARGWKTADKKPVKNDDLWRRLDEARSRHEVKWHWVKGHAGHVLNERADALANRGVDEMRRR